MLVVSKDFIDVTAVHHGDKGLAWIARLPGILAACEQRWELTFGVPFANLSYHYVVPALQKKDGTKVVVKAYSPTNEFREEAEALRLFAGRGSVRLLDHDAENEVLLLERLEPGISLRAVANDEQAISIAASVMRQLWRSVPSTHTFPSIMDWGAGLSRLRQHYDGGSGPFPIRLLEEAEVLFAELSSSMAEPVLLHGDLHQDNILLAGLQRWVAIDPKGLIGEPAYETGVLLRNFLPELLEAPRPGRILARRIDQLSEELDFERARIWGWGLYQAVLSVWWSIEDSGQFRDDALTCAKLLAEIKI